MEGGVDLAVWGLFAVALLIAGAGAGVLAGLLGVGGGILLVPILSWLMVGAGLDPAVTQHLAVGTSLATIIPTSLVSARAHWRKGSLDWGIVRAWGPGVALGAALGGALSGVVSGDVLRLVFGVAALGVAVNMSMPKRERPEGTGMPASRIVNGGVSTGVGAFSALMGIGGGTLAVPILTTLGAPIRRAVASSAAMGVLIAVPAVIGFVVGGLGAENRPPFSLGYVSLPAAALIIPATIVFAPIGASIAHRIDQTLLRRLFALFLALTSARMLWTALG